VATQTLELDPAVTTGLYCGPAIVLEVGPSSLKLQLPGREARAELALAYPYEPRPNDLVLALGSGDGDVYVVGVLQGKGRTRLRVEGDLHIEASGRLNLRGRSGVAVEGDHVSVVADRYELAAQSVVERLGDVYRWTKGVIMTCAGRTRTIVETSATLAAGRIVQKAKHDVVVDGEKIRLG
jgi:hypothetical protein